MAFEIKTMDIANAAETYFIELYGSFGWRLKSSQRVFNKTSRPVATIGNGSVNYVHTQTETVDFTKLVFERDTSMENYERLESLESQYFALQSMMPEKEPIIKSNVTFEEWVSRCGRIANWGAAIMTFIIAAIVGVVALCVITVSTNGPTYDLIKDLKGEGGVAAAFFGAIVGGFNSLILSYFVYWPRAAKKALKNPSSKEYAILQQEYSKVHAEAVSYGEKKARMILILAEAAKLVK